LDDKFSCRDQIRIERVLSPEKRLPILNKVALKRYIPVDQGRDDITIPRGSVLQDDDISLQDPGPDHRVSPHLQGKGLGIAGEADGLRVDHDASVRLLHLSLGKAGGNHSVERYLKKRRSGWAILKIGQDDVAGTARLPTDGALLFQEVKMTGHGGRRGKAEPHHDLTDRWNTPLLIRRFADEGEDFTLSLGER
jgi:hypothetical protein